METCENICQSEGLSFNPLFIRSVFLLGKSPSAAKGFFPLFQSLIHQVSVSFEKFLQVCDKCRNTFQSLIHQVSVSFGEGRAEVWFCWESFNPLFIRSVFLLKNTLCSPFPSESFMFQSLIHQVSVSFKVCCLRFKKNAEMFQSLIHQVSVSFAEEIANQFGIPTSFNPLFIRSVFLLFCP